VNVLHFFWFFQLFMPDFGPFPVKLAGACANSEDTSKGLCVETRADMRIGVPKSDFGTPEMENALFME
jgi:hypothetical protein